MATTATQQDKDTTPRRPQPQSKLVKDVLDFVKAKKASERARKNNIAVTKRFEKPQVPKHVRSVMISSSIKTTAQLKAAAAVAAQGVCGPSSSSTLFGSNVSSREEICTEQSCISQVTKEKTV